MIGVEVAPLDGVDPALVEEVRRFVARTFRLDVRRGVLDLDPSDVGEPRQGQLASHLLMAELVERRPGDGWHFLGLMEQDLYVPMLSFVFGHAQLGGPVALVSLARLRQEFHGLQPDPELLERRLQTEAAHELGHTFGLHHCLDLTCCMSLSTSIEEVDAKDPSFCRSCRIRLREWRISQQGVADKIANGRQ